MIYGFLTPIKTDLILVIFHGEVASDGYDFVEEILMGTCFRSGVLPVAFRRGCDRGEGATPDQMAGDVAEL